MFKKRTRPASVREKPAESTEIIVETPEVPIDGEEEDGETACVLHMHGKIMANEISRLSVDVSDLLLLRKLRRSAAQQQGIDLERLNRGDEGKRGRRAARVTEQEMEGASEKYGLQSQQSKGEVDEWVDGLDMSSYLDTDGSL
jgi:hypothetical protein